MLPQSTIDLWKFNASITKGETEENDPEHVAATAVLLLIAENQKLREQRDAANAHIQFLNRVIAGDAE